jgi:hypothetical protein
MDLPMARPHRGSGRRAAVLSVIVLAALVLHNFYWLFENQRTLPANERPHRSPRGLEEVARLNPRARVQSQLASFYYLARHIPGATLTLTPSLDSERWFLERVARLHVTTSPSRLVIAPKSVRQLRATRTAAGSWRVTDKHGKLGTVGFNLRLDPQVDTYVLAERVDGRELFLLPAADFPAVADRQKPR